jgi:hypothetical protein
MVQSTLGTGSVNCVTTLSPIVLAGNGLPRHGEPRP